MERKRKREEEYKLADVGAEFGVRLFEVGTLPRLIP